MGDFMSEPQDEEKNLNRADPTGVGEGLELLLCGAVKAHDGLAWWVGSVMIDHR